MITLNKTTDNLFRITYMNERGVDIGVAMAEFKPSELKALIKLNDLYFENLYSDDMIPADTLALGVATKAVIARGVTYVGNEEFEGEEWAVQKKQAASAIYAYLTSKKCNEFKEKFEEHGYAI